MTQRQSGLAALIGAIALGLASLIGAGAGGWSLEPVAGVPASKQPKLEETLPSEELAKRK